MAVVNSSDSLPSHTYTVFSGTTRLGQGSLAEVSETGRRTLRETPEANILIFDDASGRVVDLDWRTPLPPPSRGPGRPKLGVVAREITLLPRHWEWLNSQPGGASVALRKLVDHARHTHAERDRRRASQEAAYQFLLTMAGDEPGFEEALRFLYRGDWTRFRSLVASLPGDVSAYALSLAEVSFSSEAETSPGSSADREITRFKPKDVAK
jgi:hypothetical protein